MWSRRDQIQAFQFVRRRTVSAVLLGDANHAVSPTRRSVLALVTGAVLVLLVAAGFAIYGVLRPGGSTAWKADGAIVLEKESGARYVLGDDGLLHPVLNYSSARLLVGGAGKLTSVSRRSLVSVSRGPAIGIPDAPDALPAADRMFGGVWTACSSRAADAGPADPATLSVVLAPASGVTRIRLGPGVAVVVRVGEEVYLLVDGRRFRVRSERPDGVLRGLGVGQAQQVVVDRRWLATVPAGPDLGFLVVSRRGEPSDALPGVQARVGQVFVQRPEGSPGEQYYVLLSDGLAPVATTQARLALADPLASRAYDGAAAVARELPASALAAARISPTDLDRDQFPTELESLRFTPGEDVVLCSRSVGFRAGAPSVELTLSFEVPSPAGVRPLTVGGNDSVPGARVYVPAGAGALVRTVPAEGVTDGATFLVTDQGVRYAVADTAAREALGLRTVATVPLPAAYLDLLPAGPTLDTASAARPVDAPGAG